VDVAERVARVTRNATEVVTPEEVTALFERSAHPLAYWGVEPSGAFTVGHLITVRKVLDLAEAGCDVTVFLADWHAWINDKLGGDLARIGACGRYMQAVVEAYGADPARVRFRWAHDLTGSSDYWARVVRVAKATSLARTKRAMTIMGREEEESNLDTSRFFYPAMQGADMFELPVELAYGGMDQRRAHVLAREVAHHYGWPAPAAVHTPLLSSLAGSGRMDADAGVTQGKMSKSDPRSAILIPSTTEEVVARISGAFCPAKQLEGNPIVEAVRYIVFPWEGHLTVPRAPKYGGPVEFTDPAAFATAWTDGQLHPQDLKGAVAAALDRLLGPARRYFDAHPEVAPATFAAPSSGILK
jgi:tyrosyl-tRNA synthetase